MNGQLGMPLAPELALFALAVLVLIAGIVKPGRAIGWLAFTGLLAILGLLMVTPEGQVFVGGAFVQDALALFTEGEFALSSSHSGSNNVLGDQPGIATDPRFTLLMPAEYQNQIRAQAGAPPSEQQRDAMRSQVDVPVRIMDGGGLVTIGTDSPLQWPGLGVHARRCGVAWQARGFQPVETQGGERELGGGAHRVGHQAATCIGCPDPVAQRRRLRDAAPDIADVEPAHQRERRFGKDQIGVAQVVARLALRLAQAPAEGGAGKLVARPLRLPRGEVLAAQCAQLGPGGVVLHGGRAQVDALAADVGVGIDAERRSQEGHAIIPSRSSMRAASGL